MIRRVAEPQEQSSSEQACWADANWDVCLTRMPTQLWKIEQLQPRPLTLKCLCFSAARMRAIERRYDFHRYKGVASTVPDAIRHNWVGNIASTDCGMKWQDQFIEAGFELGIDSVPEALMSVRVGGNSLVHTCRSGSFLPAPYTPHIFARPP